MPIMQRHFLRSLQSQVYFPRQSLKADWIHFYQVKKSALPTNQPLLHRWLNPQTPHIVSSRHNIKTARITKMQEERRSLLHFLMSTWLTLREPDLKLSYLISTIPQCRDVCRSNLAAPISKRDLKVHTTEKAKVVHNRLSLRQWFVEVAATERVPARKLPLKSSLECK
jgi:hypothetical protein